MHVKWIVCKVKNGMKQSFSNTQKMWEEIKNSEGFIVQAGGWDTNNNLEACIISFWQNQESLKNFMDNFHDGIFEKTRQAHTYFETSINYYNSILDTNGESTSIREIFKKSKFLRITDCCVKHNKILHFEKTLKNTWMPGMQSAQGMLRGNFCKSDVENNRYFVSSFWDEEKNHKIYTENILPDLMIEADSENDLENVTQRQVALANEWKVF